MSVPDADGIREDDNAVEAYLPCFTLSRDLVALSFWSLASQAASGTFLLLHHIALCMQITFAHVVQTCNELHIVPGKDY